MSSSFWQAFETVKKQSNQILNSSLEELINFKQNLIEETNHQLNKKNKEDNQTETEKLNDNDDEKQNHDEKSNSDSNTSDENDTNKDNSSDLTSQFQSKFLDLKSKAFSLVPTSLLSIPSSLIDNDESKIPTFDEYTKNETKSSEILSITSRKNELIRSNSNSSIRLENIQSDENIYKNDPKNDLYQLFKKEFELKFQTDEYKQVISSLLELNTSIKQIHNKLVNSSTLFSEFDFWSRYEFAIKQYEIQELKRAKLHEKLLNINSISQSNNIKQNEINQLKSIKIKSNSNEDEFKWDSDDDSKNDDKTITIQIQQTKQNETALYQSIQSTNQSMQNEIKPIDPEFEALEAQKRLEALRLRREAEFAEEERIEKELREKNQSKSKSSKLDENDKPRPHPIIEQFSSISSSSSSTNLKNSNSHSVLKSVDAVLVEKPSNEINLTQNNANDQKSTISTTTSTTTMDDILDWE